jgi:hypothetical protein
VFTNGAIHLRKPSIWPEGPFWVGGATPFAPPDILITLVKFLRYLEEKYFQTLDVIDEGNYWETGDEDLLKEKMGFLSQKMDAVSQALEDSWIKVEPGDSDLDILVKIEKVLREIDQ